MAAKAAKEAERAAEKAAKEAEVAAEKAAKEAEKERQRVEKEAERERAKVRVGGVQGRGCESKGSGAVKWDLVPDGSWLGWLWAVKRFARGQHGAQQATGAV